MGAYQNGMSPGGWAPAATFSEEPWPTSSLNPHKLLFCLESHMDTQVSEGCACYFWQTPPPMTVSFENIPELVKPRKTSRDQAGDVSLSYFCSLQCHSVDGISLDTLALTIAKKKSLSTQQVQTQHALICASI